MPLTKAQIGRNKMFIAALRSGRYRQIQGQLRNNEGMCCLGVACEVKRLRTGRGKFFDGQFLDGKDVDYKIPPRAVAEYYGWEQENPMFQSDGNTAAALNDSGYSFKRIAVLFERWLAKAAREVTK